MDELNGDESLEALFDLIPQDVFEAAFQAVRPQWHASSYKSAQSYLSEGNLTAAEEELIFCHQLDMDNHNARTLYKSVLTEKIKIFEQYGEEDKAIPSYAVLHALQTLTDDGTEDSGIDLTVSEEAFERYLLDTPPKQQHTQFFETTAYFQNEIFPHHVGDEKLVEFAETFLDEINVSRYALAIPYFEKALQINPENKQAKQLLDATRQKIEAYDFFNSPREGLHDAMKE